MTSYRELSKYPRKFLAMTGYTVKEFLALLPHFQFRFDEYVKTHTLTGKPRVKRRYTTYKNSPLLAIEDKLLFILVYLKQGTTQEMHATLFDMHQPDANVWIHLLHPILNQALDDVDALPVRDAAAFDPAEEQELHFFHDGTERPISRPKDQEAQKQHYSGKKSDTRSRTSSSPTPRPGFSS